MSTASPDRTGSQPSWWLTRFLIVRFVGIVYLVAFLIAAEQIVPLVGDDGLSPARAFLVRVAERAGGRAGGFWSEPTIFWLGVSDRALLAVSWTGAALSAVVVAGFANSILLATLWALYESIVHVGQVWYGFGWEIQLLETGFLAIFLVPLFDPRPFPRRPPPSILIALHRWLAFRIMLGAGLIKLRGDPCWRDFSCLDFHYETQPLPNPLSPFFHFLPAWSHRLGVAFNHATELVAPWLLAGPRRATLVAGGMMIAFQLLLIASGNLSFLNYLTIVPVLACFDDRALARVLPSRLVARAERARAAAVPSRAQGAAAAVLAVTVALLSVEPVRNLVSPRQLMNRSFEPFELVNTYGAFGSVERVRHEIVFEGTDDERVGPHTKWQAYEFRCKPGDPRRRPCVVSPYHLRLDWLAWFAAMGEPGDAPWTVVLVWKLLHDDAAALSLLANRPFPHGPPRWVRVVRYRYWFTPPGAGSTWWNRELEGEWLPPLSAEDARLRRIVNELVSAP